MTLCRIHALLLSHLIRILILSSLIVTSSNYFITTIQAKQQGNATNKAPINSSSSQQQDSGVPAHPQQQQPQTIRDDHLFVSVTTERNHGNGMAGYLLADSTDQKLNRSNAIDSELASILNRNGPDMRPLRDFRDFDDITLDVAKRAWQLMHHHAQTAVADRLSFMRPLVEESLKAANVTTQCLDTAMKTMHAAQRLESWAIQLITSWGSFPPTGIFEGTYGDIGSFHGCVNVPQNPIIGHAHYCTVAYRPVLPTRKDYELIVRKEPKELLHLFDQQQAADDDDDDESVVNNLLNKQSLIGRRDAFTEILSHAQYNHYVYYKFGTCFPIQCTPRDVQRVAKLLGKRSILMSGPVKCHSKYQDDYEDQLSTTINNSTSLALQISTRDLNDGVYIWKPHMTKTQWVALIIIGFITFIIVSLTLIDIAFIRAPKFYKWATDRQHRYKAPGVATNGRHAVNGHGNGHEIRSLANTSFHSVTTTNHFKDGPIHYPSNGNQGNGNGKCNGNSNGNNNIGLRELYANGDHKLSSIDSHNAQLNGAAINSESSMGETDTFKTIPLDNDNEVEERVVEQQGKCKHQKQRSLFTDIVDDYSIVTNAKQFFRVSQSQLKNDILCINGIRCITMSWIIITHTMQYNDWSAFARTREIETHLASLINQPLFNASYLVDTFFLVSGLLTSFSSFKSNNKKTRNHNINSTGGLSDILAKFSSRSYLIGRYLRLTPQIMLVSMLFILLPQLSRSGSPHWYTITGEYSENCSQNWWVNLFHIQAFYRSNEMCNFVCWWISVDMLYHLFALAVILLILYYGHKIALLSCALLVLVNGTIQAIKHYQLALPPNLLSTIPQTGAMWSQMTLEFFWTPYAHTFPFLIGFYVGYLMAQHSHTIIAWFTVKKALFAWTLATSLLLIQSYSTYFWVIGKWQYTPIISTLFYLICPIVWSTCLAWIIVACHYGYGSWINQMLSCKLFIILGKASYVVYLSHFLVLFTFFGSQNLLVEPTQIVMLYVILGNICLSMLLGSFLCVIYEMPWLKTQRRLMKYLS